jgi:aminobenzoyl-glutamate utilization protein B
MAGTTHKIKFLSGCYPILNNVALAKLIVKEMREIGVPTYTKEEYEFAAELGKTLVKEEKIAELKKSHLPDAEELLDKHINTNIYGDLNLQFYPDKGTGGSTDIGDVSWNTPTVQFYTAGCILGDGGHSWQTTAAMGMGIGHKTAIFGSKINAATTLDLMTQPDLLMEIQEEFKKMTRGVQYKSPLPPDAKPPLGQLAKQFNT